MKQSKKESHAVAVRLTPEERANVAALAAIEGKAVSSYIRDVLNGVSARPRPTLAASGELLGMCETLLGLARSIEMDRGTRDLIAAQARLIITIVRLHRQEYLS